MDEDARYRTSSQYRNWSFTPSTLYELRKQTNNLAIERNKGAFARRALAAASNPDTPQNGSTPAAGTPQASDGVATPATAGSGNGVDDVQFLTVEEELKLLRAFGIKLLEIGDHLKLPTDIKATALQFFHRFYIYNSFMTYPPIPILKTTLFVACKAEHWNLPLALFCRELSNTTPEDVLSPEFLLMQSLKFNLDVRHPFRGLEGAVMEVLAIASGAQPLPDVDQVVHDAADKKDRITRAHGKARQTLKSQALLTDVYFHYTPSQIMFASLYIADPSLVDWFLTLKFPPSQSAVLDKTRETIKACAEMMGKVPPKAELSEEEMKELRALSKKLKKCQDPEKTDMAKLKKEKMEKRDKTDAEEEERKVAKRREESERLKKEGEALFGGSLKA